MLEDLKINGNIIDALPIEELELLIDALRAEIESRKKREIDHVKAQIMNLARSVGMSVEELLQNPRAKSNGKLKPKYANPADPQQTWVGRGKRPKWFVMAIESGLAAESMRVKDAS